MRAALLVVLTVLGLTLASPLGDELDAGIAPFAEGDIDYRLTYDILPIRYDLEFTPYFQNETYEGRQKTEFTFDGIAKIEFEIDVATSVLILHMNDLEIESYQFTGGYNSTQLTFNASDHDSVSGTDKWRINFDRVLAKGTKALLTVNYRGFLRDDMAGFYRSYYNENGTKVWMASTQFERAEARRAFPCFDEPGFRATFQIVMNRPADMNTVSNTIVLSSVPITGSNKVKDTFQETPPLPTYLIAMIVSKYAGNRNETGRYGVYARQSAIETTQRGLVFGQQMLAKLGEYLGIDYYSIGKDTKLDMAAIPDFSAGAMENWGLLTYRETNVLYYANDTPSINEQRIIAVIAHEQTHQWFGDLLTCKWWSETWLNEGFARYFQFFGTEMIQSGWEFEEQFVVENHQNSMQLDSTDDTHPMTDPTVQTKAQAAAIFDNISYSKAASVIRMLKHYIGLTKFQDTLKTYLADNNNTAVVPERFFEAIAKVNNAEAKAWFEPWTTTPGFPLVTVKLDDKTLKLTQKRFMRSETGNSKTERYNIPITFTIDSENYEDTAVKFVFGKDEQGEKSFELPKKPEKYYILNPKQTSYYRVNYDADNWNKIKEALEKDNFDGIHVMNRAQIVDDLFQFARAGIVPYKTAIDIIRYLQKETHYAPWYSAINQGLTFLSQRVSNDSEHQRLFRWLVTNTTDYAYKQLTFDDIPNEKRTNIYNRVNIQSWACKYGNEDCIKKSQDHFDKFLTGTPVPKNQRSTVYCNAVRNGNSTHFNFLFDRYNKEDISAEQLNLMIGMACTKEQALVDKYLDRLLKTDDIRPQDRASTINNILNSNPEGPDMLYNYVTANYAAWRTKIGLGTLNSIAGRFTTKAQFDKYKDWLKSKETELGTSHASLTTSVTALEKNLEWDDKYIKELMAHLKVISSATAKAVSVVVSAILFTVLYFLN